MPPFLSLALGSAAFTPLEVVSGYAILANGGYRVSPWYIDRIEDASGRIVYQTQPLTVCQACESLVSSRRVNIDTSEDSNQDESKRLLADEEPEVRLPIPTIPKIADAPSKRETSGGEFALKADAIINQPALRFENQPLLPVPEKYIAPRVMEVRNHYLVDNILKDVIHRGTATRTLSRTKSKLLKRNDLAGKTGTTNDAKDAWFSGYNTELVATTWVGFNDHAKKLGVREFGGIAALPVWQKFMENALEGSRAGNHPRPDGIVAVRIDPKNGLLATTLTKNPAFELFRTENAPTEYAERPIEDILNNDDTIQEDETIF